MRLPLQKILTVSQLTQSIKTMIESNFYYVWVEGEVSNFKTSSMGHSYLTLKDERAQMRAVIFKRQMRNIKFKPTDGISLVCRGMVSVYAERGEYQLIIDQVEPKGVGARQMALEQLKERLRLEGVFDESRKRPIPLLPKRVGVVTSPNGAAIRDIIKILERRFTNISLLLYPVRVQGVNSADDIAEGIRELNDINDIDVIIVGRGGGSIEDLWAFNEEVVVRDIFRSRVPVISAVGHETDFTLADMVADLRAATPSAAAEVVVKSKEEFVLLLANMEKRLESSFLRLIGEKRRDLYGIERRLIDPRKSLKEFRQRLDSTTERLNLAMKHTISSAQVSVKSIFHRLDSLSPLNVLSRGYSIVRKLPSNNIIKKADDVSIGDNINILLHKGELFCNVSEKT